MEINNYTKVKNQFSKIGKLIILITLTIFCFESNAQSGEVINLGLYGGASRDFSWAYSTNRLFSAVETPASVFYTDDTLGTWIQPFPVDSLEYTTGMDRRGWGGGANRVITNWNGWVGVLTSESGGTLRSSVISFIDGDSGTFRTAIDGYLLNSIDPTHNKNDGPNAIALTDSWYYTGLGGKIVRINDTSTYGMHNIVVDMDTSSVVGLNTNVLWLAASSDETGYPILTIGAQSGNQYGNLYSFDGSTISAITGPGVLFGFQKAFIHPADTSLDTIVGSFKHIINQTVHIYRTYDGGSNWTDITPVSGTNWPLQNADYNPDWVSLMPSSNGLRLSFPGVSSSDDLGTTWSSGMLPDNATATHPQNTNYVVGSKNKGPMISTTGVSGAFTKPDNAGHAAVRITKIAQRNTNLYYVSTKAGLGYTTAYQNPAVTGVDQWKSPYGDFPISGVGGDGGVTSVAIDPNDDNHVIVGADNGFYVSTTGPTGFSLVSPSDWDVSPQYDNKVMDVKFINSDTIVAVTGTGSNVLPNASNDYGNIWMSYDGGTNWTKSNPSDVDGSGTSVDFEQGTATVVGRGGVGDTIIYVSCGYWDMNYPKEDGQIWKSDDYGASWSFVNYGPTGLNGGTTTMPIYDLDIHPDADSNEVLYIASGQNLDYAFCKSLDGGTTMSYLNVSGHGAFSSCLVKLTNPQIVTVAARRNVFRVNTVLNSSTTVFNGLPGEFVPDLETGSTLLGTTTGFYKLVEDPGSITTIWNGNGNWSEDQYWSNGVPYEITNAIIESGTVAVDMSGKTYDITVVPTASVTINSGESLSVDGDLVLESDGTGYGSFIDDGTITIGGEVTVEKFISADQWHYISSPISNGKTGIFTGLWLDYWDEPSSSWITVTSTTEDLLAGAGYKTWASSGTTGDVTLEFKGIMNTGNYNPGLSLSGNPESTGWNLVGNSFPSAIDWGTENNPNPDFSMTNIDNTIYFWTGTQYATYNPSGDGQGANGGTQYIASAQGFFVHANDAGPALTIPQSSRIHNSQAFRNTNTTNESISLTVHSSSYSDELIVNINDMATAGFDNLYDAYKLYGINSAPQFYSLTEDDILSVNHLPTVNHKVDVPLGFIAGSPEVHTIVVGGVDSFNEEVTISLEDIKENYIINLKTDSIYTYFSSPSDDPNRFILHIDKNTVGITIYDEVHDNLIYAIGNSIIVENTQGEYPEGTLKVFDLLGRVHFEEKLNRNTKQVFNLNLIPGTYIAIISNDREVQTKKLLIK